MQISIFFIIFVSLKSIKMKDEKVKSAQTSKQRRPRTGWWLLLVAAAALQLIACVQFFYTRAVIKDQAVYRARAELRAAELEINVATAEMEAAAKMLAMMASHNLNDPKAIYGCTQTLLETLPNVESAGVAFTPYYYPEHGRWYEICSSRPGLPNDSSIYTRQIGSEHHDYLSAEWFVSGLSKDSAWWSEPYQDEAGAGAMVVSCTYPVRDEQGQVVALACIDFSLRRLSKVSQYLQVYKDSYYSISSPSGTDILGRPDTIPGRKYMILDEKIDATGWHLTVIIPEDILYAELKRIGLLVNILMLLSLGLLVFIMYKSAKNIQDLVQLHTQQQKMEGELEIARTIQNAMLPKVFPPYCDRPDLNIYGMVQPAKEIGGDLYDFYVRHDKLFFCVGDVSGKGVPASLVMATMRSLFRSTTAHEEQPDRIAIEINNTIAEGNDQNMFVTLFIGVIDLDTGMLSYCNAGHNAPIIGNKMIDVLPNLPIGVLSGFAYQAQQMQLERGDIIFLYTDGLTEAEDSSHAQYGERRMLDVLAASRGKRPREIVDAMLAGVKTFVGDAPQSDDLTMVAIRYQVPAIVMRNDIQQIPTLAEWIDSLHVPAELNMPINLALEETVTNVMLYAYPGRNDGKVFVEYAEVDEAAPQGDGTQSGETHSKRMIFTISDSGIAFDPTQKAEVDTSLTAEERPIGGLGIHLVRQLMDEVRYERQDGKNILTLVKVK